MTFKYVYWGFFLGLIVSVALFFIIWFCGGIGLIGPVGSCPGISFYASVILLTPESTIRLITNSHWLSDGIWSYLIFILTFILLGLVLDFGINRNLPWWSKYVALLFITVFCLLNIIYFIRFIWFF